MNVFFDNNLPPVYASTLHGFIKHSEHAAFHIADVDWLPRGRDSKDIEWLEGLRNDAATWIFLTSDKGLGK
ncbi:MAG: hypothetical protein RID91_22215 [Azospirillaceae bacterium]